MPKSFYTHKVQNSKMLSPSLGATTTNTITHKQNKLSIYALFDLFVTGTWARQGNFGKTAIEFYKEYVAIIENETFNNNENVYLIKALSAELKLLDTNDNKDVFLNFFKFSQLSDSLKMAQLNAILTHSDRNLALWVIFYAIVYDTILNSPDEIMLETLAHIYWTMKNTTPSLINDISLTLERVNYHSNNLLYAKDFDLAKIKPNSNILIDKLLEIDDSDSLHFLSYRFKIDPKLPANTVNNTAAVKSIIKAHILNPLLQYSYILLNYQEYLPNPKLDIFTHLAIIINQDFNPLNKDFTIQVKENFTNQMLTLNLSELNLLLGQECITKALIDLTLRHKNHALTNKIMEYVNFYNFQKLHQVKSHTHQSFIAFIDFFNNYDRNAFINRGQALTIINNIQLNILPSFNIFSHDINLQQTNPNKGSNIYSTNQSRPNSMDIRELYLANDIPETNKDHCSSPSLINSSSTPTNTNSESYTNNSALEMIKIDNKKNKSIVNMPTTRKTKRKFDNLACDSNNTPAKHCKTQTKELIASPPASEINFADFNAKLVSSNAPSIGFLPPMSGLSCSPNTTTQLLNTLSPQQFRKFSLSSPTLYNSTNSMSPEMIRARTLNSYSRLTALGQSPNNFYNSFANNYVYKSPVTNNNLNNLNNTASNNFASPTFFLSPSLGTLNRHNNANLVLNNNFSPYKSPPTNP